MLEGQYACQWTCKGSLVKQSSPSRKYCVDGRSQGIFLDPAFRRLVRVRPVESPVSVCLFVYLSALTPGFSQNSSICFY